VGEPGRGEGVIDAGESRWGMRSTPERISGIEDMEAGRPEYKQWEGWESGLSPE
jgi:hypothetical protein